MLQCAVILVWLTFLDIRSENLSQNWLTEEAVLDFYRGNQDKADAAMLVAVQNERRKLHLCDAIVLLKLGRLETTARLI